MSLQRPKNQVSLKTAQQLQRRTSIHWREWEKTIERLLTVNHYWWFHVPRMPTKQLNKRFKAGLPDYIGIGKVGSVNEGVMVAVEAKTGKGVQREAQRTIMRALLKVPGVVGGVFYPHMYKELVELLGGREPI